MADLKNDVIEQVTEAMTDAGMDVTIMEAATEKSGNGILKTVLTFVAGTGVGAGAVVLGRKVKQAVANNKEEINEEKKKARVEKLRKKVEAAQKELDNLMNDDDEDLDEDFDEEEDVIEE
jgi:hypothetical protein